MFYSQYSGVVPDIQIMAKGIAGGLPLSAIVAKNYVMKGQKPGSMGGTYCESECEMSFKECQSSFRRICSRKRIGLRGWYGSLGDLREGEYLGQR